MTRIERMKILSPKAQTIGDGENFLIGPAWNVIDNGSDARVAASRCAISWVAGHFSVSPAHALRSFVAKAFCQ
jgi:hypothetical protein